LTKVLIAGVPRSGTSWVGECLSKAPQTTYVVEPDNEVVRPFAIKAKRGLGPYPVLGPGDSAPNFEQLWAPLFTAEPSQGGPPFLHRFRNSLAHRLAGTMDRSDSRSALAYPLAELPWELRAASALACAPRPSRTEHLIVKSVHVPLALEWVADRFSPTVIVVLRHPLNVLASWKDLGWRGVRGLELHRPAVDRFATPWNTGSPPIDGSLVERGAWHVGLLMSALEQAAARNPSWLVVSHERLCGNPQSEFKLLFERAHLPWSDSAGGYLVGRDRPGEGFDTLRLAAEQTDARWRRRLDPEEVAIARSMLERFPICYDMSSVALPTRRP
jgi:hypothetical protein